jgi:hypothetical protein
VAVRTTVDIPETLQHKSYESGKALEQVYCERKQRKVTGPLVKVRGKMGPRFPTDENPHDLILPGCQCMARAVREEPFA